VPLRLVIFDRTQARRPPRALGLAWRAGARFFRARGCIDAYFGAESFAEALAWAASLQPDRAIGEVQFWGHGKWGRALIAQESFDRSALEPLHPLRPTLEALRERLTPGSLFWFRTCETLGAGAGHDFARALGDFTGASIAGHTFEIGYFQSGLHCLAPGAAPEWDAAEGLLAGTPEAPLRACTSGPRQPSTITCWVDRVPAALMPLGLRS